MVNRFMKGIYNVPINSPVVSQPVKHSANDEFLILILLFVLLAASPSLGLNSSYFFIIIMTVIGLGGVDKAFGLNPR